MSDISDTFKSVMQLTQQLGCLNINRIFLLIFPLFISGKIVKQMYISGKFGKRERGQLSVIAQVIEMPVLKITYQNGFGKLVGGKGIRVPLCLFVCLGQILATRLHLNEDVTFPEQVNITTATIRTLHPVLKNSHAFTVNSQNTEEIYQECLSLCLLALSIFPITRELGGTCAYFILAECNCHVLYATRNIDSVQVILTIIDFFQIRYGKIDSSVRDENKKVKKEAAAVSSKKRLSLPPLPAPGTPEGGRESDYPAALIGSNYRKL